MKSNTKLSEIQLILIDYLKSLHIEKDNIIMCGLMLRPDWRAWEMCCWIHDNWEKGLTQEQVMMKAQKIYQSHQSDSVAHLSHRPTQR